MPLHPIDQDGLVLGGSATRPSMPAVPRPALISVTRRTLINAFARDRSINFCRLRTFLRSPACDKDALPGTLSGGERQRATTARALVQQPRVLLCDEPTGALDRANSDVVLELLRILHDDGLTIVLVTHDEQIAAALPRRLRLDDGEATEERAPDVDAGARFASREDRSASQVAW